MLSAVMLKWSGCLLHDHKWAKPSSVSSDCGPILVRQHCLGFTWRLHRITFLIWHWTPPPPIQHVQHLPAIHAGKTLNTAHFAHYVSVADTKPSTVTMSIPYQPFVFFNERFGGFVDELVWMRFHFTARSPTFYRQELLMLLRKKSLFNINVMSQSDSNGALSNKQAIEMYGCMCVCVLP